LYKGGKEIKYNILGSISIGWIATPLIAGIMTFVLLFFVNNVFQQDVGKDRSMIEINKNTIVEPIVKDTNKNLQISPIIQLDSLEQQKSIETTKPSSSKNNSIYYQISSLVLLSLVVLLLVNLWKKNKKTQLLKQQIKSLEKKYLLMTDSLEKRIKSEINHHEDLDKELKFRQNEMVTMAMNIIHKNEFLNNLKNEVVKIKSNVSEQKTRKELNNLSLMIIQDLSIDRDREKFQMYINKQNSDFIHRLTEAFPTLTDNEKRLSSLLR